MQIEVFSDVVCPWCFIGKRRLDAALAERPEIDFDVRWRPFELHAGMPRAGVDRQSYLAQKFGGRESLAEMQERLVTLGRDVGIDFRFDRIARVPNTRATHRLIAAAVDPVARSALVQRLLSAYFEQGRDVGDPAVLAAIANESGLDVDRVTDLIAAEDGFEEIARQERVAEDLGVSGVPTFVFEQRYLLSGAQPVHVLLQVIDQLADVNTGRVAASARG